MVAKAEHPLGKGAGEWGTAPPARRFAFNAFSCRLLLRRGSRMPARVGRRQGVLMAG